MKKSRIYNGTGNPLSDLSKALEMELAPLTYEITKIFFKRKTKDMWIAKNRVTGEEYGTAYKSIYDCIKYINNDLKVLNKFYKLVEEEKRDLFDTHYNGANIIQCYNKEQNRYADGFDF